VGGNLLPGQLACDRPDIIAQVFHLKFAALLDDIMQNHVFGEAVSYVHTVEYQKQGMPHVHLIIYTSMLICLCLNKSTNLYQPSFLTRTLTPFTGPHQDAYGLWSMWNCTLFTMPEQQMKAQKVFPKLFQEKTDITGVSYVKTVDKY
jgi:hypothetical protein